MRTPPITWPGGEHTFELRIGEFRKLQENCNAGPEEVRMRLLSGNWRVDDVIEPLRLGLIGAGEMPTSEAGPFVTKILEQHGPLHLKLAAALVLGASMAGVNDDPVGETTGAENPPESGSSPEFMETEPQ